MTDDNDVENIVSNNILCTYIKQEYKKQLALFLILPTKYFVIILGRVLRIRNNYVASHILD